MRCKRRFHQVAYVLLAVQIAAVTTFKLGVAQETLAKAHAPVKKQIISNRPSVTAETAQVKRLSSVKVATTEPPTVLLIKQPKLSGVVAESPWLKMISERDRSMLSKSGALIWDPLQGTWESGSAFKGNGPPGDGKLTAGWFSEEIAGHQEHQWHVHIHLHLHGCPNSEELTYFACKQQDLIGKFPIEPTTH